MRLFEKVSKYADDSSITLPTRATDCSAGYDFRAAEDIIIPSCARLLKQINLNASTDERCPWDDPYTMEQVEAKTKGYRPTLVPTGIKCSMPRDEFLQLSVRSSGPLKHWLILGNGVGIIDQDYYNNPSNEGEIYFQIINLLPYDIKICKGDKIGQGIFLQYQKTDNDLPDAISRSGGFGSTSK